MLYTYERHVYMHTYLWMYTLICTVLFNLYYDSPIPIGIAIHHGYHLLCYNEGETLEGDTLKSVSFIQNAEEQEVLKIECDVR